MIIVNFATEGYLAGQHRLINSVLSYCHTAAYSSYQLIGSPKHQESPYQFKIHAIEAAKRRYHNDSIILWCDASLYRVGDLGKIERIIHRDGYFMEEAGHWVKDWCNAHARKYFGFNFTEHHFKMFSAGLPGLDFNNPLALTFFNQWKASALAGCFKGSWTDHRHDMTCASIIAERLGMKYQQGGSHMAYIGEGYQEPGPDVVFHLQGL